MRNIPKLNQMSEAGSKHQELSLKSWVKRGNWRKRCLNIIIMIIILVGVYRFGRKYRNWAPKWRKWVVEKILGVKESK
jgi:t-SNARE complex subunit (syntaxin)